MLSFVFVMAAPLVIPVAWVGAWLIGDLAGASKRRRFWPAGAAQGRRTPAPRLAPLRALDIGLATTGRDVTIYRLSDLTAVDSCRGADADGRCPRVPGDRAVPCAGHALAIPVAIKGSRAWHVPLEHATCPLGSYDAYRRRL